MQTLLAASLSFIPSVLTALSLLGPNGPMAVALSGLHLMHPRLSGGWRSEGPQKSININYLKSCSICF